MKIRTITQHIFLILLLIETLQCFPQLKDNKWLRRDELRLPNGTIVGKYLYYDKDGAAVNVKYFADNAGYGVELKSVKITSLKPGEANLDTRQVIEGHRLVPTESKDFNPMDILKDESIEKTNIPDTAEINSALSKKDIVAEELGKNELISQYGRTPEYDIFVEQKLDPAQEKNKKAKVYFNRNKRSRPALPDTDGNFEVDVDYCEEI